MGGGKGGADFDPKGKSDNEIRRFVSSPAETKIATLICSVTDSCRSCPDTLVTTLIFPLVILVPEDERSDTCSVPTRRQGTR